MGLFRRDGDQGRSARPHSHVALAPGDVEDAERCRPASSLAAFAGARNLTFEGDDALEPALAGVLPAWPDYVFNVCRGTVGSGRFGVVEHELLELDVKANDPSGAGIAAMNGDFWAIKRGVPPGWKKRLIPGAEFLGMAEPAHEPFAASATWAPVTTVAIHVPEAACAPRISVGPADRFPPMGNPKLTAEGLPQFRIATEIPDDLRAAVFGSAAGPALAEVDAPFVTLKLQSGQLALTRNGFLTDEAALDELLGQAVTIADAFAGVCRPGPDPAPAPFAAPLPAPDLQGGNLGGWGETFAQAAATFNLTLEDAHALHAAFPRLDVPGCALGVFRGALPAGGADGRLSFHQQFGPLGSAFRGAGLFAAPPGAEPTPPGGVRHERTDMCVTVGDGVVACWSLTTAPIGHLQITPTAERSQATARELGLLPVGGT